MEILKEKYSITELSSILQLTDHALRYYEKEFGLSVPKDGRGRRSYTAELYNVMYQIKKMRSEGLEIKAIRKILQSENIIRDPLPVASNEDSTALVAPSPNESSLIDMKAFFQEFKEQLTAEISGDIEDAKDHLSKEISKSKLELGACVENGMRRLEAKMERHFIEVDKSLGLWREKNKKGIFRKLLTKTL